MLVALLHWYYDENHLLHVKKQMEEMGAPVIKAAWIECYSIWVAFEGCHRIRAAKELNLCPIFEDITNFEDLKLSDITEISYGDDYLLGQIVDDAVAAVNRGEFIEFDFD